ncbi:glycosyltransferase [Tranquillimonas rosea]|uniref:glycosyltransferase n=1 Tax=Tranquillimonas rosea TaxID=641238 RepID=UPI003BAADD67
MKRLVNEKSKKISVIIPTYNDTHRLRCCLACLARQTLPQHEFEVLVVNNSHTPIALEKKCANVKVLNETKPGSYAARNAGIREAEGYILAFTDSDCQPNSNWLAAGFRAIQSLEVERIAGAVNVYSESRIKSPTECYEEYFAFNQEANAKLGCSVTANLFVLATTFSSYGLFDDSALSGEDIRWNDGASRNGSTIAYCKDAIVLHPARKNFREFLKKRRRVLSGKLRAEPTYKISFFRALMPPISAIQTVSRGSNILSRDAMYAVGVAYMLKIFNAVYLAKLRYLGNTGTRS